MEKKKDSQYKLVFLGGLFSEEKIEWINENSIIMPQNAADQLQKKILIGFEENYREHPIIFNAMFIGNYPFGFKKLYIEGGIHTYKNQKVIDVKFVNLPVISHLSKTLEILNSTKDKLNVNEKYIFVGYAVTPFIVDSLLWLKRKYKESKTCLIVPDLPEYMRMNESKINIRVLLKKMSTVYLYKRVQNVDSFVFITKYMKELKFFKGKPSVIMEGIALNNEIPSTNYSNAKSIERMILYTGSLDLKYGIRELVDSFCKIEKSNMWLVLCGSGNQEEYIKKASEKNGQIIFLGTVSIEKCHSLQEKAYLLINPRRSVEEYTKYSFPSKTLEYMSSGRPVLSYRLPGIPKDYEEYLYYIDDFDSLSDAINNIMNLSFEELELKGKKAKEFVMKEKNAKNQTKKIKNMFDSIMYPI